jgi:type I restriction enzyme S subunit
VSFHPYAAYVDSGVDWVGEMPQHWDLRPLKSVFTIIGGATPRSEEASYWDGDVLWATPADLSGRSTLYLDSTQRTLTHAGLESCAATVVPSESIILSTRAPIGSLAITGREMCTNQGCKALVPNRNTSVKYFAYLLGVCTRQLNVRGKGTTFLELSADALGAFPTCVPPLAEQKVIEGVLDFETAKIDALIAEQQRLIELLKEKRQAIVSHAVTKGLHPDAPMKSSGIEWLGDVPAHWEVKQLRQVVETLMDFRGRTPAKLGMDWGGDIPAISAVNVREGFLDLSRGVNYGSLELHDRWMTQGRTRRGDVLFTTEAPLGNVALVPDNSRYILSQRVVMLRTQTAQLMPEYLYRLLVSAVFRQGIEVMATGSTAEGVKRRYLVAMPICVPTVEEQRAIALRLDRETSRIDALVVEADRAITLLQERRAALISAAVTGKIDVRHHANAEAA